MYVSKFVYLRNLRLLQEKGFSEKEGMEYLSNTLGISLIYLRKCLSEAKKQESILEEEYRIYASLADIQIYNTLAQQHSVWEYV